MWRWFEHNQVYCPSRVLEAEPKTLGRPFEEVWLTSEDQVRLHGWFFPGGGQNGRTQLAFLLLHGNAGNISHRLGFCEAWLGLGVSVFLFDYRGYGCSGGRPSESGTYLDAQAAYRWLRAKGFAPKQIIAFGKSLGGGIASELALRERLGGLVLQSTFTSIPAVGKEFFPWLPVSLLSTIKYDTVERLPRIKVPLLILHSRDDAVVRYHHAERNFRAANDPKMFWEISGGHTSVLEGGREHYLRGLDRYLSAYF